MCVCVCVWGLLHVAFHSEIKQSSGSEVTLFEHERGGALSELPLTERSRKRRNLKVERNRRSGRKIKAENGV